MKEFLEMAETYGAPLWMQADAIVAGCGCTYWEAFERMGIPRSSFGPAIQTSMEREMARRARSGEAK